MKKQLKGLTMPLVRVRRNYQITLPPGLRKKLKVVVGDYVEIEEHHGEAVLKPVKLVHPDQEYFYTKEWQVGEAEADAEIARGDVVGPFENVQGALKALKKARV
jgi:antitoxin MazE